MMHYPPLIAEERKAPGSSVLKMVLHSPLHEASDLRAECVIR